MSEYTPITTDMRLLLGCFTKLTDFERDKFTQLCDAIDSIHAQLERENADLRMKLVNANRHAQHVERENESLKAELDRVLGEQDNGATMPLPLDMDGKPIRIGDVMKWPMTDETFEVVGIGDNVLFYVEDGNEKADWTGASTKRHHASDTWERILADALGCEPYEVEGDDDLMAIVARCKALCERTKEASE